MVARTLRFGSIQLSDVAKDLGTKLQRIAAYGDADFMAGLEDQVNQRIKVLVERELAAENEAENDLPPPRPRPTPLRRRKRGRK